MKTSVYGSTSFFLLSSWIAASSLWSSLSSKTAPLFVSAQDTMSPLPLFNRSVAPSESPSSNETMIINQTGIVSVTPSMSSMSPSDSPSTKPSNPPSVTDDASTAPSIFPSVSPSMSSMSPSDSPSTEPSNPPSVTDDASTAPSINPSNIPYKEQLSPSFTPSIVPSEQEQSPQPSTSSMIPSSTPSINAVNKSSSPSSIQSQSPSRAPSAVPANAVQLPSGAPSIAPSTIVSPSLPLFQGIFINCGGDEYTDPLTGIVWEADAANAYYTGGHTASNFGLNIVGTNNTLMYKSERTGGGTVSYAIPVPYAGTYEVRLHFAEIYWTSAGSRLFDIAIEGNTVATNYDVWVKAGGKGVALVESYVSEVLDGTLTVAFITKKDQMKVSAIEVVIVTANGPPPTKAPSDAPSKMPSLLPSVSAEPSVSSQPTSITGAPSARPSFVPSVFVFGGVHINCGGAGYTDAVTGTVWEADKYFSGGFSASNFGLNIVGTNNTLMYKSERTGGGTVSYAIPVPYAGTYEVRLHFAEIYWTSAGSRLFDIAIEGNTVATNYDVWVKAGGKGVALVESYLSEVLDGSLTIAFVTKMDQMKVSAIEVVIVTANGPPPTKAPIDAPSKMPSLLPSVSAAPSISNQPTSITGAPSARPSFVPSVFVFGGVHINCGGAGYTDAVTGTVWEADKYFSGGFSASNFGLNIVGTNNTLMYKSERTGGGTVSYAIPVPYAGTYEVRLHFAEIYWTSAGSRLFDIAIEGNTVATNYDVWVKAGGKGVALVESYVSEVLDGTLTVAFITKMDQMKVSAIEVVIVTANGPPPTKAPSDAPSKMPSLLPSVSAEPSVSSQPTSITGAPSARPSFVPSVFVFGGVHINCGGAGYTDAVTGTVWEADKYFSGGFSASNFGLNIVGTNNTLMYKSERTGGGTVSYEIPVPYAGTYEVRLHFAEIYWTSAGSRLFDIAIEGNTVATNYDVWVKAGGKGVALVESYLSEVLDGSLTIAFVTKMDQMKVSAIEVVIVTANGPPPTKAPIDAPSKMPSLLPSVSAAPSISNQPTSITGAPSARPSFVPSVFVFGGVHINCGGAGYTDAVTGTVWEADKYFSGGFSAGNFGLNIVGTNNTLMYKSERTGGGTVSYAIPVPYAGTYEVRLHFAEIYWTSAGSRLFDIAIESNTVATNYDVWVKAGGKGVARIEKYVSEVLDGTLTIAFVTKKDQMKVSAIEIVPFIPLPTAFPSANPTKLPSASPSDFPSFQPSISSAPSVSSMPTRITEVPSFFPSASSVPSLSPSSSAIPSTSPSLSSAPSQFNFEDIYINCGGGTYTDSAGRYWDADDAHVYYNGGFSAANYGLEILNTNDDFIYQSERTGGGTLKYEIPVPHGDYEVYLHFAEIYWNAPRSRLMDIKLQGSIVDTDFDIWTVAGGKAVRYVQQYTVVISGYVNSLVIELVSKLDQYKISGIVVKRKGDHLAHAVPGGPYASVDVDGDGFAVVQVDASQSHTHALGLMLNSFEWRFNGAVVATTEKANLTLPIGNNFVTLVVADAGGNSADSFTEIQVFPVGYPFIESIKPDLGDAYGGQEVIITGAGFNWTAAQIIVRFGEVELTGSSIDLLNETSIRVFTPTNLDASSVRVTVQNPISTSNFKEFRYYSGVPIDFTYGELLSEYGPTSLTFGPDGLLYVGTLGGDLLKITLDDSHNIISIVKSGIIKVAHGGGRNVMGIALDPMDVSPIPKLYVSHSSLFHGSCEHSAGSAINGKISIVSGANLDEIVDIVTGLPVSDHDHSPNEMTFGDNGEIYMMIGGNTNAGVPGGLLTGCGEQKENYFSGACLKIDLQHPNFDGHIQYNAVTGDVTGGTGVEVFAPGSRNPRDIVLHSNGYLYATDNGPNTDYGKRSVGCNAFGIDPNFPDELNIIIEGSYHGHPNRKRGETDPRQCIYHDPNEPSIPGVYTAPLTTFPSSTDGIIEWETEHFGGQLRGNLIAGKFVGVLWRVILSPDGLSASTSPIVLSPHGGLDVTQGPDGTLFVAKNGASKVTYLIPVEEPSSELVVKASWPRRGPSAGGNVLSLYGELMTIEGLPTVSIGEMDCPVISSSPSKITCTLPPGGIGKVDVIVTSGNSSSTLPAGYRYIGGGL